MVKKNELLQSATKLQYLCLQVYKKCYIHQQTTTADIGEGWVGDGFGVHRYEP